MKKIKQRAWLHLITVPLVVLTLTGCGPQKHYEAPGQSSSSKVVKMASSSSVSSDMASHHEHAKDLDKHHYHAKAKPAPKRHVVHHHVNQASALANWTYHSGEAAYWDVNGGKATLSPKSFHYVHVNYTPLDVLNRTSGGNTGYLTAQNVANDSLRTTQYVKPTGWHQKFIHNEAIINRGHEIAYSLSKGIDVDGKYNPQGQSGDQNNLKNLFTQTAFSNQRVQTIFESRVRNALRAGDKVVYQVKPIFRGHELMARGVQIQAISTNRQLDFNVYVFNVQPGVKFDYQTGRSTIDNAMHVPTPAGAPTFHDNGYHRHEYRRHWYHPYRRYHWHRHYYRTGWHHPYRHYHWHHYWHHRV